MCVVKHKLVRTLFSDANMAITVFLCIRCAPIRTLFYYSNVANTVLLHIRCATDLRPAFLIYSKIPPRDTIFSLSLGRSWAWWCNYFFASSISTLSSLQLCSDAACLLQDKSSSRANSVLVLFLLAARELKERLVSI